MGSKQSPNKLADARYIQIEAIAKARGIDPAKIIEDTLDIQEGKTKDNDALADVESTAKALENLTQEDLDKLTPAQKVILYKENGITNDDGNPITEKDIDENNVTLQNEREQNKEPGDRQNEGAAIVFKVGGVESRGKDNAVNNEEQRYVVRQGDRAIRNATLKQVSLSNNNLSSLQLKKVFPNDKFDDYFVEITLAERFREWYDNINNILK